MLRNNGTSKIHVLKQYVKQSKLSKYFKWEIVFFQSEWQSEQSEWDVGQSYWVILSHIEMLGMLGMLGWEAVRLEVSYRAVTRNSWLVEVWKENGAKRMPPGRRSRSVLISLLSQTEDQLTSSYQAERRDMQRYEEEEIWWHNVTYGSKKKTYCFFSRNWKCRQKTMSTNPWPWIWHRNWAANKDS
jgi:hypothetical protein